MHYKAGNLRKLYEEASQIKINGDTFYCFITLYNIDCYQLYRRFLFFWIIQLNFISGYIIIGVYIAVTTFPQTATIITFPGLVTGHQSTGVNATGLCKICNGIVTLKAHLVILVIINLYFLGKLLTLLTVNTNILLRPVYCTIWDITTDSKVPELMRPMIMTIQREVPTTSLQVSKITKDGLNHCTLTLIHRHDQTLSLYVSNKFIYPSFCMLPSFVIPLTQC